MSGILDKFTHGARFTRYSHLHMVSCKIKTVSLSHIVTGTLETVSHSHIVAGTILVA